MDNTTADEPPIGWSVKDLVPPIGDGSVLTEAQQRQLAKDHGYDGATYDPALDKERLSTLHQRVHMMLIGGAWLTLAEIKQHAGGSEAGVSARIRDLRKEKFGGHTVERRRRGDPKAGLWEYRLVADTNLFICP